MDVNFSDDWDKSDFAVYDGINVTPFIDVVLVLLIVFMVAAPLSTSVLPVQLPSLTQAPVSQFDEPLYITLQKDNSLYIGDILVSRARFVEILLKETQGNLNKKILIKADTEIDYGYVVELLNQLRIAGYSKIGLVGLQKVLNNVAINAERNENGL
ncbi:biopolymer transport protein ExbD [Bartonella australis AUST/NH1]|uniref:Biopolymer transport protein ExbD n=1 Tax=Bartonella australis (strain Aust/NH1) TaxID=1094489 RepID=M1PEE9_BARAA|nr:biopolymer transporter ExbD [Bartonella australis]AGF74996.1 biopolymer transport protein ExbD [Bartonella australis AUST/NH1]